MLACLHVRRPRRLRHLRRLATPGPVTVTRLPGPLLPVAQHTTAVPRLPAGFRPAAPPAPAAADPVVVEAAESKVRAWLHHDQYGYSPTGTGAEAPR
ncbi:hypothetical protein ACF1FX_32515 [Streptomyces sp. NPDC014646]|uniref:hypothetical protein n=1 Tax=Streptomyces sp. NPDC014646 TaxID=3364877 RepID=UPI0036FF2647